MVITIVLSAGACTSPSQEPAAPSSTPASPTTSTSADPEAEAIAAYEAMWDVVVEASREANPDHPDLERYATGDAAELMRLGLEGVTGPLEGEPTHDIEVISVEPPDEPEAVEIRDCQDGSGWVPEGSSPSNETNIRIDATITRDALAWKVTQMRNWGPETC